jgi:hypothetical protein
VIEMKMTMRLGMALGAVAALGLFAGGTASSSLATTAIAGSGAGGSGTAIACPAIEGANSTIGCGGYPIAWFPPNGTLPGVTVTGQAELKGSGPKVRDEAIRMAVADAKDQAEVAAEAAGMKLGQVISLQVSGSGYPYPLGAADAGSSSIGVASPACEKGAVCSPTVVPQPVQTFVSVTVTWALA